MNKHQHADGNKPKFLVARTVGVLRLITHEADSTGQHLSLPNCLGDELVNIIASGGGVFAI
jgi:hypothetical protein